MIDSDKVNFHTHTYLCRHADGTVAMYCEEAQKKGLALLGFSDHAPFPDDRYDFRMRFSELAEYRSDIEEAKGNYGDVKILAGLEADVEAPYEFDFLQEVYLEQYRFDYLIGAVHSIPGDSPDTALWGDNPPFTPAIVRKYVDASIRLIQSKKFLYLAHPDLWALKTVRWTPEIAVLARELLEAARSYDVPLEINAYGMRKPKINTPEGERFQYPWRPFWELAAELGDIKIVVGSDAHTPEDVWSNADFVFDYAKSIGLKPVNRLLAKNFIVK